jgi:hypothetical protein
MGSNTRRSSTQSEENEGVTGSDFPAFHSYQGKTSSMLMFKIVFGDINKPFFLASIISQTNQHIISSLLGNRLGRKVFNIYVNRSSHGRPAIRTTLNLLKGLANFVTELPTDFLPKNFQLKILKCVFQLRSTILNFPLNQLHKHFIYHMISH